MLNKLSLRNARRSAKDYVVYLITMTVFTGLMFAFNTMLCSRDMVDVYTEISIMGVMLGLATFFIVLIISWLIHYMVRFMMEKRSREFGTYLLIGMKKKQISRLFMKENMIMGSIAFLLGLVLGLFLQQIVLTIYYSLIEGSYQIRLDLNPYCFLLTFACYFGCYLLALRKVKRKFRKMNIRQLMNMDRQNQQISEKGDKWKQWLFFAAILYFILFDIILFQGAYDLGSMLLFIAGFVLSVYLLYFGLSAFIVRYIRKKGEGIYKGSNLFLMRQFSGKIKTMHFTMGTLTVLFAVSLIGCSVAMMFSDYQDKQLAQDFPFDISLHSGDPEDDFQEELALITSQADILEQYGYKIYQNGSNAVNTFLYTNLKHFGDTYRMPDGSPDQDKIKNSQDAYYEYDTFMNISDYNHLREMIGLESVDLAPQEYLVHLNTQIYKEVKDTLPEVEVRINEEVYTFAGFRTEGFSQTGHNGGDYCIVVPDEAISSMKPFYSQTVLAVDGNEPAGIQYLLEQYRDETNPDWEGDFVRGFGTKQIVVFVDEYLVKADVIHRMKYMLAALTFPLVYVGLIYLCVALTILSVQQLSDSNKYKFRYFVLSKLGMGEKEIDTLILKQLFWYYLCPIVAAIIVSAVIILFVSERFIYYAGVNTVIITYFGISILVMLGVYLLYFAATYVMFRRNIAVGLHGCAE